MKTVVLFGAGQFGTMISRLMGPEYRISCFADNCREKWGTEIRGIPVRSPEESMKTAPDCVCLCVTDDERAGQMEAQVQQFGFEGRVLRADVLRTFDVRAATMRQLADQIREEDIKGDVAELGVFRGEFAALLNDAFPERTIHLFDTFEGFTQEDVETERQAGLSGAKAGDFAETSRELVERRLPRPERAEFHVGYFPDSFRGCEACRFAFVSVDADLYAPTRAALSIFWEHLSPGGVLLVHDVNGTQFPGAGKAVREFCAEQRLLPFPLCDLHGSVVLRKSLQG